MIEMDIDARRRGEILQNRQHGHAAKPGETRAIDNNGFAAMDDVLVCPSFAGRRDAAGDVWIALRQKAQGATRQNDAEAEGHIAGVLFEHPHDMIGVRALHERREKQAGGAGAENIDPHGRSLHDCQKFDNSFLPADSGKACQSGATT